jgi:excisionase family DNA binding protein
MAVRKERTMQEDLLSPSEAAKLLGVSRQRLTQLREKGKVTAHRFGHFWLYPRADLERRKAEIEQTRPKGSAGTL